MSIFKAFFGLGKIPKVTKFFEFKSFDDVNQMGGAIANIKQQVKEGGLQLTNAQQKFLDDQMKQVEMVFELISKSPQSGIRNAESAKIFNLSGQRLDPNQPIIGGTQPGKKIDQDTFRRLAETNTQRIKQRISDKQVVDVESTVKKITSMEPVEAMKEANNVIKREGIYKNLNEKEAKKILEDTEDWIFQRDPDDLYDYKNKKPFRDDPNFDPDDPNYDAEPADFDPDADNETFAQGGRAGFKEGLLTVSGVNPTFDMEKKMQEIKEAFYALPTKTQKRIGFKNFSAIYAKENFSSGGRAGFKMGRRAFLKLMGSVGAGIGALKSGILKLTGKEAAPQVAKEVVEQTTRSTPPPYFFELANKIKSLGKPDKVTYADRVEIHRYTGKNGDEYELIEDLNTGDMKITKDKLGSAGSGDETYEGVMDRSVMEYKKGDVNIDPDKKIASKVPDEYDEYKVEFDVDGTEADADNISEFIRKEIIEEVNQQAPKIKKAGGGVAYMLGE